MRRRLTAIPLALALSLAACAADDAPAVKGAEDASYGDPWVVFENSDAGLEMICAQ